MGGRTAAYISGVSAAERILRIDVGASEDSAFHVPDTRLLPTGVGLVDAALLTRLAALASWGCGSLVSEDGDGAGTLLLALDGDGHHDARARLDSIGEIGVFYRDDSSAGEALQ